jgi:hypothetical protein
MELAPAPLVLALLGSGNRPVPRGQTLPGANPAPAGDYVSWEGEVKESGPAVPLGTKCKTVTALAVSESGSGPGQCRERCVTGG